MGLIATQEHQNKELSVTNVKSCMMNPTETPQFGVSSESFLPAFSSGFRQRHCKNLLLQKDFGNSFEWFLASTMPNFRAKEVTKVWKNHKKLSKPKTPMKWASVRQLTTLPIQPINLKKQNQIGGAQKPKTSQGRFRHSGMLFGRRSSQTLTQQ